MIVDDFHIVTMALAPDKTDSPLIIDPNRVLPFPIASQCFQLISRRRSQDAQLRRSVKLEQFPQGDPLNGTEPPAVVIVKELLSFLRAKILNHTHRILRHALYVKKQMTADRPQKARVLISLDLSRLRQVVMNLVSRLLLYS